VRLAGVYRPAGLVVLVCWLAVLLPARDLWARTPKDQYMSAEKCYSALRKSPSRQKYRSYWLKCISGYERVYRLDPRGPWAAAGLYKAGKLYLELYRRSYLETDRLEALDAFRRIVKRFPRSRYAAKAKMEIRLAQVKSTAKKKAPEKKVKVRKRSADSYYAPRKTPPPPPGPALVTGLRYWSNPNYTRIVIDANKETRYSSRLLRKDPSLHKPRRLYIDLEKSILAKAIQRQIPINDDLLSSIRAGQHTKDSVRVVVDIKSFKRYKVFSLRNPFRIVIDVWGSNSIMQSPVIIAKPRSRKGKKSTGDLARQFSLGVRRIVVDAGHGGRDFGAPGYCKGVYEKNITLQIARRLAKRIRKELGCEVILTRNSDRYLTLEERTAIANTKNADLFISIHTNAARNHMAYGLETYFLNLATDEDAILVAARENATSRKNISDLQSILNDLMQNAKINESARLASSVQRSTVSYLQGRYSRIKNKGVKQAPFYVLLGAQMPAILIETSFISNPRECRRLSDRKYQDNLCRGIVKGIRAYIRQVNPLSLTQAGRLR